MHLVHPQAHGQADLRVHHVKYVDRWGHRLYRCILDSFCFELRVAKNAPRWEERDYGGTTARE